MQQCAKDHRWRVEADVPKLCDVTIWQTKGELGDEALEAAAHALDGGFVIAVPSDTGYALAADVSYTGAADRLFAMKHRSRSFALPMLVADVEQAMTLAVSVPRSAITLMDKFWPGALTLVLPRHPDFVADLGDDDDTVGVRCPDHIVPRLLCEEVGPLATTSANHSGTPTSSTAQQVVDVFRDAVELVLDGDVCDGPQATVVDCTGESPKLLREGAIPWADLLQVI